MDIFWNNTISVFSKLDGIHLPMVDQSKTSKQNCYTDVTCIKLNALEVDKAQTFMFYSGNLVRVFIWEKPVFVFVFFGY